MARLGGTCGAVLNAANEAAVERFLAVVRSEHGGVTPAEAVVSDRV